MLPRREREPVVRTMKGILQRRHVSPARGARGCRASVCTRRPWKRRRLWMCSLEEPSGVWGAECWDSHRWNRGGLTGSRHTARGQAWYKPVGAKSTPVLREKSEGDIVLVTARTTQPCPREGPLLQRCRARSEVRVHARKSQQHPVVRSRALQRGLCRGAKRLCPHRLARCAVTGPEGWCGLQPRMPQDERCR